MVTKSRLDSFMKELFTMENAVCVIIIALLLTIVVRKCKKNEGFSHQHFTGTGTSPKAPA